MGSPSESCDGPDGRARMALEMASWDHALGSSRERDKMRAADRSVGTRGLPDAVGEGPPGGTRMIPGIADGASACTNPMPHASSGRTWIPRTHGHLR